MFLFLNLESNLNKSKNQVLHHSRSLRKHLCWLEVVRGLPGWLERETLQKQETAPDCRWEVDLGVRVEMARGRERFLTLDTSAPNMYPAPMNTY